MLTRRSIVLASIAAEVTWNTRDVFAKASQPSTAVKFDVPAGPCDCHTHIHADSEKFPFFAGRVYTPEPASPEEMTALHKALHIERVVIVTPSIYGPDNSATLYGMKARGPTARGVAVIDDKTPESDLHMMQQAGIRRIRLNLATRGAHHPGHGLAASGFSPPARPQDHRRDAAVPDRRRPAAQPASGLGAGRGDPQKDPGQQSGAALRILRPR